MTKYEEKQLEALLKVVNSIPLKPMKALISSMGKMSVPADEDHFGSKDAFYDLMQAVEKLLHYAKDTMEEEAYHKAKEE